MQTHSVVSKRQVLGTVKSERRYINYKVADHYDVQKMAMDRLIPCILLKKTLNSTSYDIEGIHILEPTPAL